MTAGIYLIHCIASGKVYVGSSNNVEKRWTQHVQLLKKDKHHSLKLQRAWNKYGSESFEFVLIEEVLDLDRLASVEQKHIDGYNSFAEGYNAVQFSQRSASSQALQTVKVSVQLEQEIIDILNNVAKSRNQTKTAVITNLIRTLAPQQLAEAAEAPYKPIDWDSVKAQLMEKPEFRQAYAMLAPFRAVGQQFFELTPAPQQPIAQLRLALANNLDAQAKLLEEQANLLEMLADKLEENESD